MKILTLSALFVAGALAVAYFTREPSADGRTLSEWLRIRFIWAPGHNEVSDVQITNAVRKIGVKAIPVLLDKLDAKDARWKQMLGNRWGDKFSISVWAHGAEYQRWDAICGFSILGTQAVVAIPKLTKMLNEPNASYASSCLAVIGPEGWAVLKSALTNPVPSMRQGALIGLHHPQVDLDDVWSEILRQRHDTNYSVVVQAMYVILSRPERAESISVAAEGLTNSSPQIQALTLLGLREYWATNALPLVPLILPFLTNADYNMSRNAKFAILKADPATARIHSIPENGNF